MIYYKRWESVNTRPGATERAENITRALRVISAELEKMGGFIQGDIHIEESQEYTYESVTLRIDFETFTLAEYVSRLPPQQGDRD
jgi:hypothetical protein